MRNIKFRAWLPVGEWTEDGESRKYEMVGPEALAFENYMPLADQLSDCENLMQFTGLLDKQDKEIYEGDILQPCHFLKSSLLRMTVVFKNGTFCLISGAICLYESLQKAKRAGNDYEVIGNIYETPNLLTG